MAARCQQRREIAAADILDQRGRYVAVDFRTEVQREVHVVSPFHA